jgi:hypothetical protein
MPRDEGGHEGTNKLGREIEGDSPRIPGHSKSNARSFPCPSKASDIPLLLGKMTGLSRFTHFCVCLCYPSATVQYQVIDSKQLPVVHESFFVRWFFVGVALAVILVVIAGFGPSIVFPTARKTPLPLTPLVAIHGIICVAWLGVYLAQAALMATNRAALHKRLGLASAFLALALVITGYATNIAMGRRGYDLSGDLHNEIDPIAAMAIPLANLITFSLFLCIGFAARRHAIIHKRAMFFATVGGLTTAPLAHIFGHNSKLNQIGPAIVIPIGLFLFIGVLYDRYTIRRIHPFSLWGASAIFVFDSVSVNVIGPSALWHRIAQHLLR